MRSARLRDPAGYSTLLSTAVRDEAGENRPARGSRPGYKIESHPTTSGENYIYFTEDFPGNRWKPGASQI
jgi:hypothetical protein